MAAHSSIGLRVLTAMSILAQVSACDFKASAPSPEQTTVSTSVQDSADTKLPSPLASNQNSTEKPEPTLQFIEPTADLQLAVNNVVEIQLRGEHFPTATAVALYYSSTPAQVDFGTAIAENLSFNEGIATFSWTVPEGLPETIYFFALATTAAGATTPATNAAVIQIEDSESTSIDEANSASASPSPTLSPTVSSTVEPSTSPSAQISASPSASPSSTPTPTPSPTPVAVNHNPQISLVSIPASKSVVIRGTGTNIDISKSDPDSGDTTTWKLEYSSDAGSTWTTAQASISASSYHWSTSSLADGVAYRLRFTVQDSHGATATTSMTQSFAVAAAIPTFTALHANGGPLNTCDGCHAGDTVRYTSDNYSAPHGALAYKDLIVTRVSNGSMPPGGLSTGEKQQVLIWAWGGAPEN